ncbi:MAG: radical SAM/SPASM domain-containing protein [Saprospiraceae bacterium]|nr:SPASM domain-containing protein [Candidatus Vicinibacter proximus]
MRQDYLEGLIFLKKWTLRKAMNTFKVWTSFRISKMSGKSIHWGMPVTVAIEPTTACNLRCPECPSGLRAFTRPTGNLRLDQFKQYLDPLKNHLSNLIFYFQGEPFINPELLNMVRHAHQLNIYTSSSTNAHFLDEDTCEKIVRSGLDRLILSIDGLTQESYEQYRIGGDLVKVLQGTKNLVAAKEKLKSKTPFLVFQFLVVRHNEHEIEELKTLAKELGVDKIELKTAQVYNYVHGSKLIPEQEVYSRYQKKEDGTFQIKNPLHNECWRMWQGCVITWDGRVVPCCFDKDADHQLGKLATSDFLSIWRGKNYKAFRQSILKGRDQIDICRNCTEGTTTG